MSYRDFTPRQWLWLIGTESDVIYHCDEDWLVANLSVEDLGAFRWTESMVLHVFSCGYERLGFWLCEHCDVVWGANGR